MEKCKTTTERKSLTLDDLIAAEKEIIMFSQRQNFAEEIKALQKDKQVSCNSRCSNLIQFFKMAL